MGPLVKSSTHPYCLGLFYFSTQKPTFQECPSVPGKPERLVTLNSVTYNLNLSADTVHHNPKQPLLWLNPFSLQRGASSRISINLTHSQR